MKIEEINIKKFGKLKNKDINFSDGINLVQGKNESGKSTLLQFIFSSFFGFYKYKRDGVREIDLWRPWDDSVFSGQIKYKLNNGKTYYIDRDFNEKNPSVFEGRKNVTDRYLRNKSSLEILEEQIGIDEEIFKNVVISKQNLQIIDDQGKNNLIQKIINKSTSGNENISLNSINKKLNDKLRDEIGSNQTKAKPINIIDSKLYNLYEKKDEFENLEKAKIKIEKDRQIVQDRFSSSSEKIKLIKKVQETKKDFFSEYSVIEALKSNLKLKYEKQSDIKQNLQKEYRESIENITKKNEYENKYNNLNFKIDINGNIFERNELEIEEKNKRKKEALKKVIKYLSTFLISLLILILTNIILKNTKFKGLTFENYLKKVKEIKYLKYTNVGIISAYILTNIVFIILDIANKKKRKIKNEYIEDDKKEIENKIKINEELNKENKLNSYENNKTDKIKDLKDFQKEEEQFLKSQMEFLSKDLKQDEINIKRREEIIKKKEKEFNFVILKEFSSKVDSKYIKSILLMSTDKLKTEEGMLKQIYEKAMYSLSALEAQKLELNKKQNQILEIEEEISKYEEERKELLKQREIIQIAKNILEEANEDLKKIIDPNFINVFNNIIFKITDGKYSIVNIEDESEIYAKDNEINKIVNIKKLSGGTIDQFNLAFRIATLCTISDENMPIILDEAFANYDNYRLKNILKYLNEIKEKRQIIILTSNDREKRIMDKEKMRYNYIEM